jgi:hypothetical protein
MTTELTILGGGLPAWGHRLATVTNQLEPRSGRPRMIITTLWMLAVAVLAAFQDDLSLVAFRSFVNSRHAVAPALVGWYLMVRPFRLANQQTVPIGN